MTTACRVAPSLQPDVELLAEALRAGSNPAELPAFAAVTAWCEQNPDESCYYTGDYGDSFVAIHLETFVTQCDDGAVASELEMADEDEITDEQRVEAVRKLLCRALEDVDGDFPLIGELRLHTTSGTPLSLCFHLGDGGEASWLSAYPSLEVCRAEYRSWGAITSPAEAEAVSDATILEFLGRPS